jgi:hypothetical protein
MAMLQCLLVHDGSTKNGLLRARGLDDLRTTGRVEHLLNRCTGTAATTAKPSGDAV